MKFRKLETLLEASSGILWKNEELLKQYTVNQNGIYFDDDLLLDATDILRFEFRKV